jgi:hypothetical protein
MSGCTIVLLIFMGICLLLAILIGVAVYQVMQNENVKQAFGAVGKMINAPGRQELEAAGCERAMVMDMRGFADLAKNAPNAKPTDVAALEQAVMVTCALSQKKPELTCEHLSRVYFKAQKDKTKVPPQVTMAVYVAGEQKPVCIGRYDADGKYLGEPTQQAGAHFQFGQPLPGADGEGESEIDD